MNTPAPPPEVVSSEPVAESLAPDPAGPPTSPSSPPEGSHASKGAHDAAQAVRNAIKLGSSLLATWTVALIVRFQVPRHIGPERFGTYNFADNFAATFFTMLDLGVDTYIVREISVRPKHASDFFGGILALRAVLSVVLFGAMAFTLGVTHRSAEIQAAAVVFGFTQLIININNTLSILLQASSKVGGLAIVNVLAKLLWGVGILVGLHFDVPLPILAVPMLVAELFRLSLLAPVVHRTLHLQYRIDIPVVKGVLLASLPFFMNTAALGLGGKINVAVLEYTADPKELGWFSATQNISSLSMLLTPLLSWVVMPLMARAKARSQDEVLGIVRRVIEGLVVVTMPLTLMLCLGADLWIQLAFGKNFAPAAMSMRVLSLVFVLTYLAMLLASTLIVLDKGWTLTRISAISVPITPMAVLILAPIFHRLLGEGGQATAASSGAIVCEIFVVSAYFHKIGPGAIDRRAIIVIVKSVIAAIATAVAHHFLVSIGHLRLILDMVVYVVVIVAIGGVHIPDVINAAKMILPGRRAKA